MLGLALVILHEPLGPALEEFSCDGPVIDRPPEFHATVGHHEDRERELDVALGVGRDDRVGFGFLG